MHLPIIWIERIPLLQVYFSHFIAKQGTIFKDTCIKQGTQFCSLCSFIGLIYWSFKRQIPCAKYVIVIIYHKFFGIFFRINFPPPKKKKNLSSSVRRYQETFSVRCYLTTGVLQGLVGVIIRGTIFPGGIFPKTAFDVVLSIVFVK